MPKMLEVATNSPD